MTTLNNSCYLNTSSISKQNSHNLLYYIIKKFCFNLFKIFFIFSLIIFNEKAICQSTSNNNSKTIRVNIIQGDTSQSKFFITRFFKKIFTKKDRKYYFEMSDRDGDGVPDYFDKDNATLEGAHVYGDGTSVDNDGDGIPDSKDADPFSFKGAKIDANGLAVDSDGDGVPDENDLEQNTRKNSLVNFQGKAIVFPKTSYRLRIDTVYQNYFFIDSTLNVKIDSLGFLMNQIGPQLVPANETQIDSIDLKKIYFDILFPHILLFLITLFSLICFWLLIKKYFKQNVKKLNTGKLELGLYISFDYLSASQLGQININLNNIYKSAFAIPALVPDINTQQTLANNAVLAIKEAKTGNSITLLYDIVGITFSISAAAIPAIHCIKKIFDLYFEYDKKYWESKQSKLDYEKGKIEFQKEKLELRKIILDEINKTEHYKLDINDRAVGQLLDEVETLNNVLKEKNIKSTKFF